MQDGPRMLKYDNNNHATISGFTASNILNYIHRHESYKDIAAECGYEGDVLLMRHEPTFNDILQSPEIPTSEEFWVGDLIYTEWILPLGLFTSTVYTV